MGQELQIIIRDWAVVGNDRIVGTVHQSPGPADARTIMTSPVVQVRLMGMQQVPVAFTESGSVYCLGEPSAKFGNEKAEAFVRSKTGADEPLPPPPVRVEAPTTVLRLEEQE